MTNPMPLLHDFTDPDAREYPAVALGLLVPALYGAERLWIGLFVAGEEDHLTWSAPWMAACAAEAASHSPAAENEADEGRAEAKPDAPTPDQAGPTRPGGEEDAAHSVTAGRDRHHFLPDGAGTQGMAAHEPRREPMLLWRNGDHSVIRQPAPAARALGPCHPVYFRSLAPYRPNRAERGLRPVPSPPAIGGPEADFFQHHQPITNS